MSSVLVGPAFRRLAAMSTKDLLRNPLTGLSMIFMFAMILAVYVSIWLAFMVLGPSPTVTVSPESPRVTHALQQAGVDVAKTPPHNAEIAIDGGQVLVTLDAAHQPAWNSIWIGLRDAGFAPESMTVRDPEGEVKGDPLRENLAIAAMLGIASVAFIGTTVPIVAMRERGLLRLFGTTPLRRVTFLLAQLPTRALIAVALVAVTVIIAIWQRYVDAVNLLSLGLTFVLGLGMLLALALLFAARSRSAEATQQGMVMLTITLVFASGGLLPAEIVPGFVQALMNCLPTTWLAASAGVALTGADPFLPLPILWLLMGSLTVAAAALAARLFEWDQSEPRQARTSRITHIGASV